MHASSAICSIQPLVEGEDGNKLMDAGKSKTLAIIVSVLALISSLKWLLRWRPVVDHSMERVKEMAQQKSSIPTNLNKTLIKK
jgi:hypothetical protein